MKTEKDAMVVLCSKEDKAYLLHFREHTAGQRPAMTLRQAAREAALEYYRTEEGYGISEAGSGLAYEAFLAHVPERILEKYGLARETAVGPKPVTDGGEMVLSARETALLREAEKFPQNSVKWDRGIRETAAQMGIMWGILSTLQDLELDRLTAARLADWAEEFVRDNKKTLIDFFQYKLEEERIHDGKENLEQSSGK